MPEFRLYTPEGASVDLDALIAVLEGRSAKAHASQEAMRRALAGSYFRNTDDLQKATAEVSVQIGCGIAFDQAATLLKSVRTELVRKNAA